MKQKPSSHPLISQFLDEIVKIMTQNKISQAELAKRLKVSQPYISKLLQGENLTLKSIAKITDALDYQATLQLILRKK